MKGYNIKISEEVNVVRAKLIVKTMSRVNISERCYVDKGYWGLE